jgi:phage terminase large subunit GpA-like protein
MTTDLEFIAELNDEKPTEAPPALISEYVNNRRIMPPGSPRPGAMDIDYTPYTIEIMDCMGPYSGVNRVSVEKGVQIALTTCAENVIGYYMDANPAEIMYCTASDALLKKWRKRLEALIDSLGFRHKIQAQETHPGARRSGDTSFSKEYSGGSLSMSSLQSPAGQRSESNRILVIDEADGAPATHTTGEGSYLGTLEGRTVAYGSKYKIFELSTPALLQDSVIHPQFMAGDQRYYNMPCPRCGAMIIYKFEFIRPVFNRIDQLESVFYECQECNKQIFEHEKTEMMRTGNGLWIPTAEPRDPTHRSYHISALYSPVGMLSWQRIYDFYLQSEENPDRKPSFKNLYEGMPFKEDGQRPDVYKAIALRGDYKNGTVPDGVIYLTMAADVQRGSERYQAMTAQELTAEIERLKLSGKNLWKANLPRIELEVFGVGKAYRSWSVDYRVFYGHTTQGPYEGAFEQMYQWVERSELTYHRKDGILFYPKIALMDASDGVTQNAVFEFCDRLGPNTYPNINDGWLKKKKDPELDEETHRNFDRYRLAKKGKSGPEYIQISTNYYKKIVYQRIKIDREKDPTKPQRPGFCDFPMDRADHYFHMLTGEELLQDGSFHNGGRPVEALDVRGYNLCAADVYIESQIRDMKAKAEKARYRKDDIDKIDKKYFLALLEKGIEAQVKKVA